LKAIPKQIHIIWLGGDIPQRNRDCIKSFVRENRSDGWQVNLWIDVNQMLTNERSRIVKEMGERTPERAAAESQWNAVAGGGGGDGATMQYLTVYMERRGVEWGGMRIKQINSIMGFCSSNGIKLHEVQRDLPGRSNSTYYSGELVKPAANFGSASDILRIEILHQFGGIYVDTDIECASSLGEIICHESYPRFSASDPAWVNGVTEAQWLSDDWWSQNVKVEEVPKISNSIIASHAKCGGLKSYRKLIETNFKSLATDNDLRTLYLNDFRRGTIRMTGPTAASESSGFKKLSLERLHAHATDKKAQLDDKLYMRDNWYFPMYKVVDHYFHDWLPVPH
jgi:hypothetical protein